MLRSFLFILFLFCASNTNAQNLIISDLVKVIGMKTTQAEKELKSLKAFTHSREDNVTTMVRRRSIKDFPIELHYNNDTVQFIYWREPLGELPIFYKNIKSAGFVDSVYHNNSYIVYSKDDSPLKFVLCNFANQSTNIIMAIGNFDENTLNSLYTYLDVKLLGNDASRFFIELNENSPIASYKFKGGYEEFRNDVFNGLSYKNKFLDAKNGMPVRIIFDLNLAGKINNRYLDLHTWSLGNSYGEELLSKFKKSKFWRSSIVGLFPKKINEIYTVDLITSK